MPASKVAVSMDLALLAEVDSLVARHVFANRSQAIQTAVREKLAPEMSSVGRRVPRDGSGLREADGGRRHVGRTCPVVRNTSDSLRLSMTEPPPSLCDDYRLLDFGDGRRLERFGEIVLTGRVRLRKAFRGRTRPAWAEAACAVRGTRGREV